MPNRYDRIIEDISAYAVAAGDFSELARETARWVLFDALGSAMLSLGHPQCVKLLGGLVPGVRVDVGARVPGTDWELDPIEAAFNLGTMIRWLDYNDTWLALEWGHPSDNLGAILSVADWLMRSQGRRLTMGDVLSFMIKAHEIQGVLSLSASLNRRGLDHVWWTKIASTAVVTALLTGEQSLVEKAVSQAFLDGGSLRTYRQAPNTGSRKSWAAGDAVSRAVRLALITLKGEMGYPTAVSAPGYGFNDVALRGQALTLQRPLSDYVMENILFKVAYPAEFHGQTAVECALWLHPQVKLRIDAIEQVIIETQDSAMRIINKVGPLVNPADRDHCLQYMVAVALIQGVLTDASYDEDVAGDPRIDLLRAKMRVVERPEFSKEYLDPDHRSIANAVQVFFADGSSSDRVEVRYPLGHRRRRQEAIPLLKEKFEKNVSTRMSKQRTQGLLELAGDPGRLGEMPVDVFVDAWISPDASHLREGGNFGCHG